MASDHEGEGDASPRVRVCREARIPDPARLDRYARAPEVGPQVLFFSGGSALRRASRCLTRFTHRSRHLITPFDSGGSSAKLRDAFGMLSVGDLRNRMMALADEGAPGGEAVQRLFARRLPEGAAPAELALALARLTGVDAPDLHELPPALAGPIGAHLREVAAAMPAAFDLRGASVGNLVLVGAFLRHERRIDAAIEEVARLLGVRGHVQAVVADDLHLVAELVDGSWVAAQHRITDPAGAGRRPPIARVMLSRSKERLEPASATIDAGTAAAIADAELICFPIGSFFTSVIACLLPRGVGAAVARSGAPKVFVPNLGEDPELCGVGLRAQVEALLAALRADAGEVPAARLLDLVLVDRGLAGRVGAAEITGIRGLGVRVLEVPLAMPGSAPLVDGERLVAALLSLV